jgi:VWFA-related protein
MSTALPFTRRNRFWFQMAAVFAVTATLAVPFAAGQNPASAAGAIRVEGPTHGAKEFQSVSVSPVDGVRQFELPVDANGVYGGLLPPGKYRIVVHGVDQSNSKPFQTDAGTMDIVAGKELHLDFHKFPSARREWVPMTPADQSLPMIGEPQHQQLTLPPQQQTQPQQTPPQQPPSQQQPNQQQQQNQATPSAGGPTGDLGPMALPKKKDSDEAPPPAPAQPAFKNPEGAPNYSLKIEVPEVTLDVGVLLDKTGQFVPGLKPENFRVFEDGVQQKVIGFKRVEAPITVLILCEFSGGFSMYSPIYYFNFDMLNAAWAFAQQLRPQDYAALMTYDMHTHIITDFTQDKRQIYNAINTLQIPGFAERNLFDALYEAEDRLSRIPGRKYIVLIGSGRDTFSKLTLDQILKKVKNTPDITIFSISTGGALRAMTEGGPGINQEITDLDYLQADNQMKTFARMTGGQWFEPRFEAEFPDDFAEINKNIRSKYELIYHPTNAKQDGTYRKLRVELVDDEGKPLRFQDEKHHPLKYEVQYRDGYRAKPEVE